jgi:transcriptional regulator with XRE-family HTH domain
MSLGQRIKKRRRSLKITQLELAQALGLTPQHISALEQDKRTPSITLLGRLATELGTSIDYLVTGKEGAIIDIVPAIKASKDLGLSVRKALITLVDELRKSSSSEEA